MQGVCLRVMEIALDHTLLLELNSTEKAAFLTYFLTCRKNLQFKIKKSAEVMSRTQAGSRGCESGAGGGRVFTVRNVDTLEWIGRVMPGNTLGRNRQDARVFHIPTTKTPQNLTFSHYFYTYCLTFSKEITSSLLTTNKEKMTVLECSASLLGCLS